MEEIRRMPPPYICQVLRSFSFLFVELGMRIDSAVSFHKGDIELWFDRKTFKETGRKALEKLKQKPGWGEKKDKDLVKKTDAYFSFSRKLLKTNLKQKTNKELARLFQQHNKTYIDCHEAGMFNLILEFEYQWLSDYVKELIESKIKEKRIDLSAGKLFLDLTTPLQTSFVKKEELDFHKMAKEIFKKKKTIDFFSRTPLNEIELKLKKVDSKAEKRISEHHCRYQWIPYMYEGPSWNKKYFYSLLQSLARQKPDFNKLMEKISVEKNLKQRQEKLMKKLGFSSKEKRITRLLRDSAFSKVYRKDAMYFGCFTAEPLYREIAKRLHLSLNQARYFHPDEIPEALLEKKFDSNELNERYRFSVYRTINRKSDFLAGKKARAFYKTLISGKQFKKVNELQGSTAFEGEAEGTVKVINHPNEIFKMNEGDILVSHSTNPNLVPAIRKASAIITDLGGMTCHAAIVSRELGIPCVLGTRIATKVLKDGDSVEVNATKGIIRRINK